MLADSLVVSKSDTTAWWLKGKKVTFDFSRLPGLSADRPISFALEQVIEPEKEL